MLQRAEFFPFSLSGVVLFQRPGSFAIIPYFFLPAGSDFTFFDMETRDWRDLLQMIYFFSEIGFVRPRQSRRFLFSSGLVSSDALPFSGIETRKGWEMLQKRN